jgi:hypothetical protein
VPKIALTSALVLLVTAALSSSAFALTCTLKCPAGSYENCYFRVLQNSVAGNYKAPQNNPRTVTPIITYCYSTSGYPKSCPAAKQITATCQ